MHNLAAPHGEVDGRTVVIERNRIPAEPSVFAPAGGIACSLGDMLTWLQAQLGRGTLRGGVELFSAEQLAVIVDEADALCARLRTAGIDAGRAERMLDRLRERLRQVLGGGAER